MGLLVLTTNGALADRIICRDGTIYEGIIISENIDTVVLEIPSYPIRVTIYKGAVRQIRRGTSAENAKLQEKISRVKEERGFVE